MSISVEPGSFRDPSGFIFYREQTLYRQVQPVYRAHYDRLMQSGLYDSLTADGSLISHREANIEFALTPEAYRILEPEPLAFISYPYEWCFSQLRDAALTTLHVQTEALRFGMTLKDASTYNIQFRNGKPVLIDTLSFENYVEGKPWTAYRQFCQHFLAPLALMSRVDIRLGQLLRTHLDGIPLDLASRLLPRATFLTPGLLTHIHLHGAAQKRYADAPVKRPEAISATSQPARAPSPSVGMGKTAFLGLLDSLQNTIRRLSWQPAGTTWADYYEHTNYSDKAMEGKKRLVSDLLAIVAPSPASVWDMGANTGVFSRLASERGIPALAWDIDPAAVEKNYRDCRAANETRLLPLLQDLTNPSPDQGWGLRERSSLLRRGRADMIFALALVHHLAIVNNVPLRRIAEFFRDIGAWLIVEWVPKSDSQVQRLLASRDDVFPTYTQPDFETEFGSCFEIIRSVPVPDSERTLYLMQARGALS